MQQVAAPGATNCNMPARIKPAEAARQLKLNRSSLKRYFDQYPELLDAAGTVDIAELQQHRADNPRITVSSASSEDAGVSRSAGGGGSRRGSKGRV